MNDPLIIFMVTVGVIAAMCFCLVSGASVKDTEWTKDCELVGQHRVNTTIYTCSKGATK